MWAGCGRARGATARLSALLRTTCEPVSPDEPEELGNMARSAGVDGRALAWEFTGADEVIVRGPHGREFVPPLEC
jgi:hypothetical protein